jgi:hypothetical protein
MSPKLLAGTLAAIAGAIVGAIAWAAITAATSFQIGYMALGVGFLAGFGMRAVGGGRERADGIVAGVIAFAGCVLGNLLAAGVVIAQHEHYPIASVLLAFVHSPRLAGEILREGFSIMDVLFYAIAVYAGYRTALKPAATAPPEPAEQPAPPAT